MIIISNYREKRMEFFSIVDGEFLRSEKFDKFVNESRFVFLRNFEKAKELNLNYK